MDFEHPIYSVLGLIVKDTGSLDFMNLEEQAQNVSFP